MADDLTRVQMRILTELGVLLRASPRRYSSAECAHILLAATHAVDHEPAKFWNKPNQSMADWLWGFLTYRIPPETELLAGMGGSLAGPEQQLMSGGGRRATQ